MRELKIRCWDMEKNEWYCMEIFRGGHTGPTHRKEKPFYFIPKFHNKIMELFTGLNDKNGKEIFEGDICDVINPNGDKDNNCVVEYNSNGYIYEPEGGYGEFDISSIGWAMEMEFQFKIIGNIHENPELLK